MKRTQRMLCVAVALVLALPLTARAGGNKQEQTRRKEIAKKRQVDPEARKKYVEKMQTKLAREIEWRTKEIERAGITLDKLAGAQKEKMRQAIEQVKAYVGKAQATLQAAGAAGHEETGKAFRKLQQERRQAGTALTVIRLLQETQKIRDAAARAGDNAEAAASAEKLVHLLERKADLEVEIARARENFEETKPRRGAQRKIQKDDRKRERKGGGEKKPEAGPPPLEGAEFD